MTECGTAAFDVPFQKISECVQIKTAVSKLSNQRTILDVPLVLSSLVVILLSSAAASMYLILSTAELPSIFVTHRLALHFGQLVRRHA